MPKSTPKIILIVALSENKVIGQNNTLPWHLPNDFKHFKAITWNKKILMGRKTYESIGKPLPNREMIVLTHQPNFKSGYAQVIHDYSALFPLKEDLYVIGGSTLYDLFLPLAHFIYATEVKCTITGDTFFPSLDKQSWQEIARDKHYADDKHAFNYDFVEYDRI